MERFVWGAFAFIIALLISALIGKPVIKKLKEASFGQEIREDGPSWHKKKSGTPTIFCSELSVLQTIILRL